MDKLPIFTSGNHPTRKHTPGHGLPNSPAGLLKSAALLFCLLVSLPAAYAQCNFKTIGHRGGSSYYYPENTLLSLEQGFIEGIYAAEIDVRHTSDSVLVLMHDSYIDRTTNGSGEVKDLPFAYIQTLDAGSWKDPKFKGTPVPTLKEALLLAHKYQRKLYLNMKVFAPKLIARALSEANVPADLVMPDPDSQKKVEEYHRILPHTPLVYFGKLPEQVDDPSFYTSLKNNGVTAIEIPADYIRFAADDYFTRLRNIAHSYQLELWAYTVNDQPYFQLLKDFGIDALETDRPAEANHFFCNNLPAGFFPRKQIAGQWDFNNNLQGTVGSQLVVMGDPDVPDQKIRFGTTQSFRLPLIENTDVTIVRIPAFDPNHALRFFSNIAPEGIPGKLACDNTYSLVFDLLKPSGKNMYTAIFQTSNKNADDADFFLNGPANSFGIFGEYSGSFADSTWVRLALVFDLYNEKLDKYLDGNYVGTIRLDDSQDGRFCINNNWGVQASNFFSDEDGETNPLFVSSIQIRNYAMSADEIKYLGKPKATKISTAILPDAAVPCPEFVENLDLTREGNTIHLTANAGTRVNYQWEMNKGNGWEHLSDPVFRVSGPAMLRIDGNTDHLNGYKFRCIALNDCQTVSNEFLFNDIVNSNPAWEVQKELFIMYPNPSDRTINIGFHQPDQQHTITIYSILGIELYKKHSVSGQWQHNLNKGTYLVRVSNDKQSEVKKLLITE